jgi:hypothetical protein
VHEFPLKIVLLLVEVNRISLLIEVLEVYHHSDVGEDVRES